MCDKESENNGGVKLLTNGFHGNCGSATCLSELYSTVLPTFHFICDIVTSLWWVVPNWFLLASILIISVCFQCTGARFNPLPCEDSVCMFIKASDVSRSRCACYSEWTPTKKDKRNQYYYWLSLSLLQHSFLKQNSHLKLYTVFSKIHIKIQLCSFFRII